MSSRPTQCIVDNQMASITIHDAYGGKIASLIISGYQLSFRVCTPQVSMPLVRMMGINSISIKEEETKKKNNP